MSIRVIKMLLYIIGFSLAVFAIIYTAVLFMVDLFPENSYKVSFVAIIAVVLLLIARRISEKSG